MEFAMVQTKVMYKFAILFLALFVIHEIASTEGRQIKSLKKQRLDSNEDNSQNEMTAKLSSNNIKLHHNAALVTKDSQPIHIPSRRLGAGHPPALYRDDFQPTSSYARASSGEDNQDIEGKAQFDGTRSERSVAQSVNDFRPTAPGYSPGVGHSFTQRSQDAESKAIRSQDDFRPTAPGYSPGVGHPFTHGNPDNDSKVRANSTGSERYVTQYKDDTRPTQPGHSPGVGHLQNKNPERNA